MDTSDDEGSANGDRQSEEEVMNSDDENESQKNEGNDDCDDISSPHSHRSSDGDQSDDEVHISDANDSAGSDNDDAASVKEETQENNYSSDEEEDAAGSDNENIKKDLTENDQQSDKEDSVQEIDIDSEDENLDESANSMTKSERMCSDDALDLSNDNPLLIDEDVKENEEKIINAVSPRSESDGENNVEIDSDNENNEKVDTDDEDNAKDDGSENENSAAKIDSDSEEKCKGAESDAESDKDAESDVEENEKDADSDVENSLKIVESNIEDDVKKNESDEERQQKDDSENDEEDESPKKKKKKGVTLDSDDEAEEDDEKRELIVDIFGESDEDEKEDKNQEQKKKKRARIASDASEDEAENKTNADEHHVDSEPEIVGTEENNEIPEGEEQSAKSAKDSDDEDDELRRGDFISDFDLMMLKKKEENSKRRKRRDFDIINDSDDLIAELISKMRQAAEEDRELNKKKQTATRKLQMFSLVISQLKKIDLKMAFLDQGVLTAMAEWLAPLPDRSLPNLKIREGMLNQLLDFTSVDSSHLKASGIGKAVMYLYKHPKETKINKEKAQALISNWARPIFNVQLDYHSLTKEEREQRDYDHVPMRKRKLQDEAKETTPNKPADIGFALTNPEKRIRPGDKGWIGRARVPMPSTKDYVVRPKWNVENEMGRIAAKKPLNRLEKHMRRLADNKRNSKAQRAVTISIEGRKMAI